MTVSISLTSKRILNCFYPADLAAFRKISPGGPSLSGTSAFILRGSIGELATLLMLNDELQQRSIEWLRSEMKAKKTLVFPSRELVQNKAISFSQCAF